MDIHEEQPKAGPLSPDDEALCDELLSWTDPIVHGAAERICELARRAATFDERNKFLEWEHGNLVRKRDALEDRIEFLMSADYQERNQLRDRLARYEDAVKAWEAVDATTDTIVSNDEEERLLSLARRLSAEARK